MIKYILSLAFIFYLPFSSFSQPILDTLGVSDFNTNVSGAEKYVPLLTEKTADIINSTGRLFLVDLTSNQSVNSVIERAQENYKGNWINDKSKINPKKIIVGEITVLKFTRVINPSNPGYKTNLQVVLKLIETESTKLIDSYEFSGQSSGVNITQESSLQEALNSMNQTISSWIITKFPLKLKMVKILKESTKSVEEIVISGGTISKINIGDQFDVLYMDSTFNPPIPEIIGKGIVQNVLNENYCSLKITEGEKLKIKKITSLHPNSLLFRSKL